jgi:hypothetical protein
MAKNEVTVKWNGNLEPLHEALRKLPGMKPKMRKADPHDDAGIRELKTLIEQHPGADYDHHREIWQETLEKKQNSAPVEQSAYAIDLGGEESDKLTISVPGGMTPELRSRIKEAVKDAQAVVEEKGLQVGFRIRRNA